MTKGKHHVIIHTFVIFRSVRFLLNVSVVLVIAVKRRRRTFKKYVRISNSWKETINEPELSGKTGTNNNFINHISGTSSLLMIVFQEGAHKTLLLFLYMGLLLSYHHVCLNGIGHLFCARFIDVALELRASGNSFF